MKSKKFKNNIGYLKRYEETIHYIYWFFSNIEVNELSSSLKQILYAVTFF